MCNPSAIDPTRKSTQGDVWHPSAVFYKHAFSVDRSSIQVSELAWSMAELSIIPWQKLLIQYLPSHSFFNSLRPIQLLWVCQLHLFFFLFFFIHFLLKTVLQGWACTSFSTLLKNIWIPCTALGVSFEEIREKYVISMRYVDWYMLLGGCAW